MIAEELIKNREYLLEFEAKFETFRYKVKADEEPISGKIRGRNLAELSL
jgi:hypothetical protein